MADDLPEFKVDYGQSYIARPYEPEEAEKICSKFESVAQEINSFGQSFLPAQSRIKDLIEIKSCERCPH